MKKQLKGIIGLGATVVVLGGGLAIMKLTEKSEDNPNGNSISSEQNSTNPSENTQTNGVGIILNADVEGELDSGVVKSVKVINSFGEFNVVMKTAPTEDSAATYTIAGYEDLRLSTSIVGTLANNGKKLVSASIIEENCENLDKFGLKNPSITVELTYESGNVRKFYVGDKTPVNSQMYVRVEGSNTVYTVENSSLENYKRNPIDFVDSIILEEPSEDDYPIINSLRVERDDIDYDILLEYDKRSEDSNSGGTSSSHLMIEPVKANLTIEKSQGITNGMFGLSSESIYSVHCTEDDIAKAGLDEPFCRVTMKCDDNSEYVLLLSEKFTDENEKNCYYGMLEGDNVIYTISEENAVWASVMPVDIASKSMLSSIVWNVSEISIDCENGDSVKFVKTPLRDDVTASDASAADFSVKKNGEECDFERFRGLYSVLLRGSGEDLAIGEKIPEGKPLVTVGYTDSYLGESHVLEFYERTVMTSLVVIDGECRFICKKSYVDTLIENVKRTETGEEYITTYK